MLLAGPQRRPVSYASCTIGSWQPVQLRRHRSMIRRGCRTYAADQVGSLEDAQRLLQHSDPGHHPRHICQSWTCSSRGVEIHSPMAMYLRISRADLKKTAFLMPLKERLPHANSCE